MKESGRAGRLTALHLGAAVALVGFVACGGAAPSASDARYPVRPDGCVVKLFHDAPGVPTDNIGPVNARCGSDVSSADCLRTLEDQVCKLGGDVVWGVLDKPETSGDKNVWSGRAAHTKGAADGGSPAPY